MSEAKKLGEIYMMGVEEETYKKMVDVAKRTGKTVPDVASEALKTHLDNQTVNESKSQKKLLMEG